MTNIPVSSQYYSRQQLYKTAELVSLFERSVIAAWVRNYAFARYAGITKAYAPYEKKKTSIRA